MEQSIQAQLAEFSLESTSELVNLLLFMATGGVNLLYAVGVAGAGKTTAAAQLALWALRHFVHHFNTWGESEKAQERMHELRVDDDRWSGTRHRREVADAWSKTELKEAQVEFPIRMKLPRWQWRSGRITEMHLDILRLMGLHSIAHTMQPMMDYPRDTLPDQFLPHEVLADFSRRHC